MSGLTIDLTYWKKTRKEAYDALIAVCGSKEAADKEIAKLKLSRSKHDLSKWDDSTWTDQLRALQSDLFQKKMKARLSKKEEA
jgi:hypothetical protein